jgi:Asp-tRNA(Asn)/Glu-tRNA(Gln) amidotransferase A subunit family amidase
MPSISDKKNSPRHWLFLFIIMFIITFLLLIASLVFDFHRILFSGGKRTLAKEHIDAAEKIIGLDFTDSEIDLMFSDVKENLEAYKELRSLPLDNRIFPAVYFDSSLLLSIQNAALNKSHSNVNRPVITLPRSHGLVKPENLEELAFAPVTLLAQYIAARLVTSEELTRMYINRLKRYDPKLKCVVTLMEQQAVEQARRADREIAAGKYRGPLHGIPWGAKDLLATQNTRTTWGAEPFKNQVLNYDATVVQRLEEAGAVLVAKLSMGALAWGDVWFGGTTKNPWNMKQGSSGSSAGPASATAAGLVGFSIGTETWGSIVSPSTRCGVTGLRPTYGRVSRYGAMALSWSMDKIGPICRSAEDCALVFNAIHGPDGKDFSLVDLPFQWNPSGSSTDDIKALRIGYVKSLFEKDYPNKGRDNRVLKILRDMGLRLKPVELPDFPVGALSFILNAEAAAAFDGLTRSGDDDRMVRQVRYAWPNVFRHSRLIPAVEYIKANRFRTLLIKQMAERLKNIDVYVVPSFGGNNLLLTNLTGHPAVVVPNGFSKKGGPTSITFMGNLFKESEALMVARAYQEATRFHKMHPNLDRTPTANDKNPTKKQ